MEKNIQEIAQVIGAKILGNKNEKIQGIRGIQEAKKGDLTFLADEIQLPNLEKSSATVAIVPLEVTLPEKTLLQVQNPTLALAQALNFLYPNVIPHPQEIHPTVILGKNVRLGKGVAIGPYTVIGDNCEIGDQTIIHGGVHIDAESRIGVQCIIYSNVSIRERTRIGNRVILQPGVVLGGDGFGFTLTSEGHFKIPQVGNVIIEDDVEIGANSCVDRATLESTIIGRGTKIDNQVQIGHNDQIGENCILCGQVGIAGSVRMGNRVFLGGKVGVRDHVSLGNGVRVGAKSGITHDLSEPGDYLGWPAKPLEKFKEINNLINKLPDLFQKSEKFNKT